MHMININAIFLNFQLIERAIKKGPEDPDMMKLANHWCLVSSIHLLFYFYGACMYLKEMLPKL
jgi:hypothetical protein